MLAFAPPRPPSKRERPTSPSPSPQPPAPAGALASRSPTPSPARSRSQRGSSIATVVHSSEPELVQVSAAALVEERRLQRARELAKAFSVRLEYAQLKVKEGLVKQRFSEVEHRLSSTFKEQAERRKQAPLTFPAVPRVVPSTEPNPSLSSVRVTSAPAPPPPPAAAAPGPATYYSSSPDPPAEEYDSPTQRGGEDSSFSPLEFIAGHLQDGWDDLPSSSAPAHASQPSASYTEFFARLETSQDRNRDQAGSARVVGQGEPTFSHPHAVSIPSHSRHPSHTSSSHTSSPSLDPTSEMISLPAPSASQDDSQPLPQLAPTVRQSLSSSSSSSSSQQQQESKRVMQLGAQASFSSLPPVPPLPFD